MLTKYRADIQNSHKEHFPKNSNEKTLFSFVSKIQIQIQIVARSYSPEAKNHKKTSRLS